MFDRLMRVFRPLDTRAVDAAIAEAGAAQRDVRVRARALRMDVACGDPGPQVEAFVAQLRRGAGAVLRDIYHAPVAEQLPRDLQQLLDHL